jgi:hypothetical protein
VTLPQTTRPRTTLAQGDASHHACATSTTRHSVSRVLPRLRRSYRLTKPRPKITRERERERETAKCFLFQIAIGRFTKYPHYCVCVCVCVCVFSTR